MGARSNADRKRARRSTSSAASVAAELVSWALGVAFGRFDIRLATGDVQRDVRENALRALARSSAPEVDRETITQAARTGKIGDGKIFVYSLEQAGAL